MARVTMSYRDYNREGSVVSLRISPQPLTEIGVLAFNAAADELVDAVNDVSIGLHAKTTKVWEEDVLAAPTAAAASENAQRERKWLCRFYDTETFRVGSFEIPAADLNLLQENSEYMDLSAGAGAALKSAVEEFMISSDGNEVILFEVVHVGRNT